MKVPEIVEELSRLVQLEADAIASYDAAIELLPPGPLHDELALFRLEHQRHALSLYDVFLQLGASPPEVKPEVKGVVIGALTPRRIRSLAELLEAMRGNEQLTTSLYAKAGMKAFPEPIRARVERMHDEERHHLEWIERTLSRLGASAGAVAAYP
jgi:rubrerythrin